MTQSDISYSFIPNPIPTPSSEANGGENGSKFSAFVAGTIIAGVISGVVVTGASVANGPNTPQMVQRVVVANDNRTITLTNRESFYGRRDKKIKAYNTNFITATHIETMTKRNVGGDYKNDMIFIGDESKGVTFDLQPAYDNIKVQLSDYLEGTIMDNRYFDVVSDRLYKSGFAVFGTASILLPMLWLFKVIPIEIGLIGSVMSLTSVIAMAGMKFLFRRNFPWV